MLTKKDLDEVLTHYPQIRKKILETAEERQRMVAERAKAFAKKKEEDKKREEENKLKVFLNITMEFNNNNNHLYSANSIQCSNALLFLTLSLAYLKK